MDTFTHIAAGTLASDALLRPKLGWAAPVVGAIAALAPDLDVVVDWVSSDPLSHIRYHRGVTHSLAFVPVAAVIIAAIVTLVTRRRRLAPWYLLAAGIGLVAHVLLDVVTNYGMLLLWPWSHERWALDWLGFIDPYLLAILVLTLAITWRRVRRDSGKQAPASDGGRLPPWRGVALRGLAMVALYVLAMGGFHNMAMGRLARELGDRGLSNEQIGRMGCSPVPLVPAAWNAFYTTDDGRTVHVGVVWLMRQGTVPFDTVRSDEPSLAIEAFEQSEVGRTWLAFARYPIIRDRPGPDGSRIVSAWDARFQTWMPIAGRLKGYGSAIRAEVAPDGRVTNVSVGSFDESAD